MLSLKCFFYLLFIMCIIFILTSYPLLQQPFDMWVHLTLIESFIHYSRLPSYLLFIMGVVPVWHYIWALIFKLLSIQDVFVVALTIHRVQFIITFLLLFFSAKNYLKLLGVANHIAINYLALFSALIFFAQTGTFSVLFQLSWITWYSINYQIVLPLYFYVLSILFLFFGRIIKWQVYILICVLSVLIAALHGMEAFYLILAQFILSIFYLSECIIKKNKIKYSIVIQYATITVLCLITVKSIALDSNFAPITAHSLWQSGKELVNGANRINHSYSYLMYLSLLANFLLIFLTNNKRFILILLSINILFYLIPTFLPFAALFSILSPIIVWRFFFATVSFFLFPALMYFLIIQKKIVLFVGFSIVFLACCFSYNVSNNILMIIDQRSLHAQFIENKSNMAVLQKYLKGRNYSANTIFYARADISNLLNCSGYRAYTFVKSNPSYGEVVEYANKHGDKIEVIPDVYLENLAAQKYFNLGVHR